METILIDSNIYQVAVRYAQQNEISVQSLVETYLLSLRNKLKKTVGADSKKSSTVLSYQELRPELQEILDMSAPMKGKVPEWDLDGDLTRNEVLKEI